MTRVLAFAALVALYGLAGPGCGGVMQRFPDAVQASLADSDMRRLETARFIIYYPAHRRADVDRFLIRADRCAGVLRASAMIRTGAALDKMVIAMPEAAVNNAFVIPEFLGYEHVSVVPLVATLDFTTEFGLPPDPGYIACHELVHYVQATQVAGFWRYADALFGHLYSPQIGYDPWFLEGLATYYEARLSPGVGRPRWPIFTGMFAAGYSGRRLRSGDLSELGRLAPVGHHYLVGSMFVRFLAERYGEEPLWLAIKTQARAFTGLLYAGTFKAAFGKSLGTLIDEFDAWCAASFPVRERPAGQRTLAALGSDARYARGRDGTEAWITRDVDAPAHLVVRDPRGEVLADIGLVGVLPPRTLVQASPLLSSGLSITADGREVWLTVIDAATTHQVPRLLRWRRGESQLTELADDLGPGATIDPRGKIYYYSQVDGDRWSLAAWDIERDQRRVLVDMAPGTYVLGAQVSPDGARLVASVWDGSAFVAWVIDAATGARIATIGGSPTAPPGQGGSPEGPLGGAGTPIWDPSFTDDGRISYLGVVDGRFQVMLDGIAVTDAPYAVLAARQAGATFRFLNRAGWTWTLDEIAVPPPAGPGEPPPAETAGRAAPPPGEAGAPALAAAPPSQVPAVESDAPYSAFERVWFPQLRAPALLSASSAGVHLGLVLGGGDRLGLQRWTVAGYVQPRSNASNELHWGGNVAYLNAMLAPWFIAASAGFLDWVDPIETDDPEVTLGEDRRTRDAELVIARQWRTSVLTALSAVYTEDSVRSPGGDPASVFITRRLGGPALSVDWTFGDSTPYTGLRRALFGHGRAAYFPEALSSFTGDVYDVGGSLGVRLPLPFGRRHVVRLAVRGRGLVADRETGLLQLGGESGLATLFSGRSVTAEPPEFDTARFPPNLRFIEPMRGYEDYAIATDRVAIADLGWRYPLIIDRGFATMFGFVPTTFLRQIDFELFATGAVDRQDDLHAAAGAAIDIELVVLRVPFAIVYQVARRLYDDNALTQLVGLGF